MQDSVHRRVSKLKDAPGSAPVRLLERGGVPFLIFPSLEETGVVVHGFSTRLGGVSDGIFSSMNLSFSRGDDSDAVRENFERIAAAVGFDCKDLVFSDQTHTVNIRKVTRKDRGKGFSRPRDYTCVDGLVTDEPGLTLATFFADCVPLYFVDPVRRCIGLSHSGRKGTAGRIGRLTVERMSEEYGSDPVDIRAVIGPSICGGCYEVGPEVIEEFEEAFDEEDWPRIFRKKDGLEEEKYLLDLWQANEIILLDAGITKGHLATAGLCTCCNPGFLFSHRASKGRRGNLAAFLMLKAD